MENETQQKIRRMSDVLASQVAAGEVVERPASVVKELMENSIDAGANMVRVEIVRGGVSLMKVTDNGCGMSREDALMCLERHATSKLTSYEDLSCIENLGFRGEALPSIASVAELRITTRREEDVEGTIVTCNGGVPEEPQNAGCAPGTEICVRNLFFNTPVRRKFLKSNETEAGHIEHEIKVHALAYPNIRFVYIRDGQLVFDWPATADLRQRISEFAGRELAAGLLRVKPQMGPGVHVSGYLMPLSEARRNRRMQFIFLNTRSIEDKIIARAVRDGYGGFPTGLHPALFLYLEVEPALVDVNVHPAKREVRFRRPSEVTLAIMDAVASTLAAHARGEAEEEGTTQEEMPVPAPVVPEIKATPVVPAPVVQKTVEIPIRTAPKPVTPSVPRPTLVLQPLVTPRQQELDLSPSPAPAAPEPTPAPLPNFRHIGTLHGQYAIFENKEGMVLMSPRAARERIIFERLQESNKRPLVSQRLLVPELLELDTRDMGVAMEVKPQLEQAGFQLSPFGRNTLRVEAVPALLPLRKVSDFVQELLRVFTSGEVRLTRARSPFEPFARQLAKQYAQQEDVAAYLQNPLPLLAALLECEIPYCSPGGKSTLLPFPMAELNRRFQN